METNLEKRLDEIPSVELPCHGTYKFIVACVTDGKDAREVLIGDPTCQYHEDIYERYNTKLPGNLWVESVLGGGKIRVGHDEILANSDPEFFGQGIQPLVKELLQEYTKGTTTTVKVDMWAAAWRRQRT